MARSTMKYPYPGKLLVLHGLQRLPLRPLDVCQVVLVILGTGDHGLREGGYGGNLTQADDDLNGLAARGDVAQPDAAHHYPDARLDEVGAQPARLVDLAQGLQAQKN
jgi:hypothetical protein